MKKTCSCLKKVDALLAKQGDGLMLSISLRRGDEVELPIVATMRKGTKSFRLGSTHLVASYCPFCGRKYRTRKGFESKSKKSKKSQEQKGKKNS